MRFVLEAAVCCFSSVVLAQEHVVIGPAADHIVVTYRIEEPIFRLTFNTPTPHEAHILSADVDVTLDATGMSVAEPRAVTL
jgi:hypothetical protein